MWIPLLEAASAGRVPISHGWNQLDVPTTTGYILPTDPEEYVRMGIETINKLKANPTLHRRKCVNWEFVEDIMIGIRY